MSKGTDWSQFVGVHQSNRGLTHSGPRDTCISADCGPITHQPRPTGQAMGALREDPVVRSEIARMRASERSPSDLWGDCKELAQQVADTRHRAEVAEAKVARVEALIDRGGDLDNGILVWDLRAALDGAVE